jgi:beta-1,4-mannosyl-glycoprotein beta-1,4-N-acetylglucosaminyltransferase
MEMLDLRVKILEDVVDVFIVKEAPLTFRGEEKECLASTYRHPKVRTMHIDFSFGMSPWDRDTFQKNHPVQVPDNALVLMSDVDEIPDPNVVAELAVSYDIAKMYIFQQSLFLNYLNVKCNAPWQGTHACGSAFYRALDKSAFRFSDIKNPITLFNAGWHFSFTGGAKEISRKIKSYAHEEYDNENIHSQIETKLARGEDVLNRSYKLSTVDIDETYPKYIQEHQDELAHLVRIL